MSKHKDSQLPPMNFPMGRVVPKAPFGVLGAFIQQKLLNYVEPQRAGTAKGEPVGLSKTKYYAALLAGLTSLDLKRIAREVRVSYLLVRKWRTEEPFSNAGYQAAQEFVDGYFDHAAKMSFRLLMGFGDTVHGEGQGAEDMTKRVLEQKLIGFEDAAHYSWMLLDMIIGDAHTGQFRTLADRLKNLKSNEKPDDQFFVLAGDYLAWTYCIDRIGRLSNPKAHAGRQQHSQRFLNILIMAALSTRPVDRSLQDFAFLASGVLSALLR